MPCSIPAFCIMIAGVCQLGGMCRFCLWCAARRGSHHWLGRPCQVLAHAVARSACPTPCGPLTPNSVIAIIASNARAPKGLHTVNVLCCVLSVRFTSCHQHLEIETQRVHHLIVLFAGMQYHFWMSTFTVIHHTAPHIPFKPAESWNVCAPPSASSSADGLRN